MEKEAVSDAVCPRCEGRGWEVAKDGGAGTARRCSCFKKGLAGTLLEAARLPRRYTGCRLANFDIRHQDPGVRGQLQKALADSQRYVDGFLREDGTFRSAGLIYVGPPGAGKTHLAAAVLVELIQSYRISGRFADFTSLIHQIQSSFDPKSSESKREVLDPVINAPLLVLDELGSQKPTPWVQDILYLIINTRYNERRPTFFTTNYSLDTPRTSARSLDRGADLMPVGEPLSRRIEARLVSRLCEMARPILLDSVSDHRREVKMPANRI